MYGIYHTMELGTHAKRRCVWYSTVHQCLVGLLQGPNLTNNLIGVLLYFTISDFVKAPLPFMTDIEGMFHQLRVATEDVDFQHFLWWPDGDITKDLEEHRMVVHIFGVVSSPS